METDKLGAFLPPPALDKGKDGAGQGLSSVQISATARKGDLERPESVARGKQGRVMQGPKARASW